MRSTLPDGGAPVDFGVIAEQGDVAIGAAWGRQFSRDEQPVFYLDERTPEISIGVTKNARGQGVGEYCFAP